MQDKTAKQVWIWVDFSIIVFQAGSFFSPLDDMADGWTQRFRHVEIDEVVVASQGRVTTTFLG